MRILRLALLTALLPSAALAHAGHGPGSFAAGALHPLGGADHILAMVAVGLLAAQLGGRALWAAPLAFVAAMVLGGLAGAAGLPFPAVEPMILASIIVLGALTAIAAQIPLTAALPLIALFGAAHGWAHGAEGPQQGLALYALGFVLVTGALHAAGIVLGRAFGAQASRGMGATAAVAGLALAVM